MSLAYNEERNAPAKPENRGCNQADPVWQMTTAHGAVQCQQALKGGYQGFEMQATA